MLPIKEIDNIIKEVFNDAVVKSVKTVYEKTSDKSIEKLIISIHGMEINSLKKLNESIITNFQEYMLESSNNIDTKIIHTKFIFYVNKERTLLVDNKFSWLYDINCVYKDKTFKEDDIGDLKDKVSNIIDTNDFGKDLKMLSDFLNSPVSHINEYLQKYKKDDNYSVYSVVYNPKFKIQPCEYITFDFDINVENLYKMNINIKKINVGEEMNKFKIIYKIGNDLIDDVIDDLTNLPRKIGDSLIELLNH